MDTVGILVVEGNDAEAEIVEAALVDAGYTLAGRAVSGEEGVRMARSLAPGAVLMAVGAEDAADVMPAAAEISERFNIPVIFMSALARDRLPVSTGPEGPYGYLPRPVKGCDLRLAVEMRRYKHRMDRELAQARHAAEAADRAKTSFLATISHELRTPMNGVLGMTELLLLSDLDEPYRENVVLIKDSALSLLSVLNQIIDYSKLETSSMKLREMDFRIEDLLTGVLSQYRRAGLVQGDQDRLHGRSGGSGLAARGFRQDPAGARQSRQQCGEVHPLRPGHGGRVPGTARRAEREGRRLRRPGPGAGFRRGH